MDTLPARFCCRLTRSATLMILTAFLTVTGCVSYESASEHSGSFTAPYLELMPNKSADVAAGSWSARLGEGKMGEGMNFGASVVLREQAYASTFGRSARDLVWLNRDDGKSSQMEFQLVGDAGTVHLTGQRNERTASGSYSFEPNTSFVSQTGAALSSPPPTHDLFLATLANVSASDISGFAATGLRFDLAQATRLKQHGVQPDYVRKVRRQNDFTVEEIIQLRNNGVPADFPAEVHDAGLNVPAQAIIRLRNNGVSGSVVRGWKELGRPLGVEEIIRLRNNGVSPDYGKAVVEVLPDAEVEQIIRLRNNGVGSGYLKDLKSVDPKLTAAEVIRLRNMGVSADYLMAWRKSGLDYSTEDIIQLRNNGVSPDYASVASAPDRKPLSADAIIRLRNRGLSPKEVRELRE
ncbi:MAG TPA: hypothetical protein VMF06_15960 [Candidatus Limnocylindria bacterium]|nr:hypothetical protein [Candidatus Limnocylindria bacterium]